MKSLVHKTFDVLHSIPVVWRIGLVAIFWAVFITYMHTVYYSETTTRETITLGYMPVVTNLAAPLLDDATLKGDGLRFKAIKFESFADLAEALRDKSIDAAFLIAPLSIVMRQQGSDIKIVYIGNRHESTLVVQKNLHAKSINDLAGKTIAVPMRYSGHNLSILDEIRKHGLENQINVVEMNPPDMAAAMSAGVLDAYYVGEPFAAKTLQNGDASRLFYVEQVWKNFICNLAVVREDTIKKHPKLVAKLVSGAVRSGIWAGQHPDQAAKIASKYWNQPVSLVKYALTTPKNRIVYNEYTPKNSEMQHMANMMVQYGLLEKNDISGLIDDSFAKKVNTKNVNTLADILK